MMDNFLEIEHNDDRLKHIKVALVMADCSKSAVANPVNFIVSEGEGMYKNISTLISCWLKLGNLYKGGSSCQSC